MKPRILLVDDHLDLLKLAHKALSGGNYEIRMARDGAEGLKIALEIKPDLIVTDVQMPTLDGWTMVKQLRSHAALALVPVIFLTSRAGAEDHVRGFALGADDYVDKSKNFWELPERVARALARRREMEPTSSKPAAGGGLKGRCDVIGLASLLTVIEAGHLTGILRISRVNPVEDGVLYVVEGRVHRAELRPREDLRNREAIFALLARTDGTFEFSPGPLRVADDIKWSTAQILVEAARRIDEASHRGSA